MKRLKELLFSLMLISEVSLVSSCTFGAHRSETPQQYMGTALQIIKSAALNRDKVNWTKVHAETSIMTAKSTNISDTYPAINYVLFRLSDNHSFLMKPDGTPFAPPSSNLSGQEAYKRAKTGETIEIDGKLYGQLVVGPYIGMSSGPWGEGYANSLVERIERVSSLKPAGWIVDLRENTGGNMWPMLAGLGPLIGDGTIGFFKLPGGNAVPWFYGNGESGTVSKSGGKNVQLRAKCCKFPLKSQEVPVAVLINGTTASSGEAVAIAFKGRINTRFFGHRTCGLSTSNEQFQLSDGAILYLTTAVDEDRNHSAFINGVDPDEVVEQGGAALGSAKDPVIQSAVAWLRAEKGGKTN